MNRIPLFLAFLLWLLPVAANAQQAVLSAEGYGKVKFGTKLVDVEALLHEPASPKKREASCDYVTFKKYPKIRFMVEQGVVTRADAKPGVNNSAKVYVGASLKRFRAQHPNAEVRPHKYDNDGHYLMLITKNGKAALLFEESRGKITAVRAGLRPAVEYVEGCS